MMMTEGELTALGALFGTIGTGIAWIVHRWDKRRKAVPREEADLARATEDAPEAATEAVEEALRVVKSSLVEDLERVRRDAARDRAAARRDRERHSADRERIATLEEETGGLRADMDDLKRNEGRLVAWVITLHAGVQAGTIPPLPDVPEWLDILLQQRSDSDT